MYLKNYFLLKYIQYGIYFKTLYTITTKTHSKFTKVIILNILEHKNCVLFKLLNKT